MGTTTLWVQPSGGRGNASNAELVEQVVTLRSGEYVKQFKRGVWVSTHGRVFGRKARKHKRNSYWKLSYAGKTYLIHRVVAELFLPGVGNIVRHLDDNRDNNCAKNLAWGSAQQNNEDARRNGCLPTALTEDVVRAARLLVKSGKACTEVAQFLGVANCTLHRAVIGDTWKSVDTPPVPPRRSAYTRAQREWAVSTVEDGVPVKEVARMVGCAMTTIYDWLRYAA